jgi:hypothetical protein
MPETAKELDLSSLTKLDHLSKPEVPKLAPENLIPESNELKKELEEKTKEPTPDKKKAPDPRTQRDYPFDFDWVDGRGKHWRGKFTNHVLNMREKQLVGVMRARMAAGMSFDSLDPFTAEINLMIAHMTYSLDEDRPTWAKDLQKIDDIRLLQELYTEVANHEAIFLGWEPIEGGSESKS